MEGGGPFWQRAAMLSRDIAARWRTGRYLGGRVAGCSISPSLGRRNPPKWVCLLKT